MKALVDADILVYRFGFASEGDPAEFALARLSEFLDNLYVNLPVDEVEGYLTGKGNFRNEVAVTAPYKGTRKADKPYHFGLLREYMQKSWGFIEVEGIEADDKLGIEAYKHEPEETIIVSLDKDLNMIRGNHYNFVKDEQYYITEEQAIKNFYMQMLTGDAVDNIIGLKGIGPVKAAKILKDCKTELDMYEAVYDAYVEHIYNELSFTIDNKFELEECSDMAFSKALERTTENGRLLWILREEGQVWQPPQ